MSLQIEPGEMGIPQVKARSGWRSRLPGFWIFGVLALAAVLRFNGLDWDKQTHMHPDERFLTMVETSLQFPQSLAGYFDTAASPLNPHNVGHRFFVYGTLPIFIVRVLGEWVGQMGYDEIHIVGRAAAAAFDLVSVFLVYLIGRRLYGRPVGLLAATFSALSVLLIQHAHFFVVEAFANTFVVAGIYFAVRAMQAGRWYDYALFGVATGMAVASKISAVPLAGVIVLASIVRLWGPGQIGPFGSAHLCLRHPGPWARAGRCRQGGKARSLAGELTALTLAGFLTLLSFRVFQPYAFEGPTFFGVKPNALWLQNMREVQGQASGIVDAPFALQWANRPPVWFAIKNLVLYGLGWPLGLLAWIGWGWALGRMIKGDWERHLLPVVWTGGYFLWRSTGFTPAMRYLLPIYPTLALMAGWAIWEAYGQVKALPVRWRSYARISLTVAATCVLGYTAAYAVAFARNYSLPFTRYEASQWIFANYPGPTNLILQSPQGERLEPMPLPEGFTLEPGQTYSQGFTLGEPGTATAVIFPHVEDLSGDSGDLTLTVKLLAADQPGQALAETQFTGRLPAGENARIELRLPQSVELQENVSYVLQFETTGSARLALRGAGVVSESSWDDGLPLRIEGRDGYGGLYRGFDLELYWPDDQDDNQNAQPDKLERIVDSLGAADYLAISSNRQYGSIGRVPQRYPLSGEYYRALLGCPAPKDIERCVERAQPGNLQGELGYELVAVFQRDPSLGPFRWRDQLAEEAFTVYDHPKVLIFAKSADFDPEAVRERLAQVDTSNLVNAVPKDLGSPPKDLMLSEVQAERQRTGGTWSELFSRDSLINRWQPLAVIFWWMLLGLLGLLAFPIVRAAFPGFTDGGYPLARLVGIVLISWASWMGASLAIVPYTRVTILAAVLAMAGLSAFLAWRDRDGLLAWFRERRREVLWVELVALGFFLFDLAIRLGNPDLWHRYLGGEKPMDFSYLNAVLKSTSFPPFDPWYAGGYINYYYFGFVLVATPIKLLGVVPSVAYNLVLPTLFSLAALAAFAVGTNLVARLGSAYQAVRMVSPRLAGLAAAISLVVIGNLGTVRLIYDGLRDVGSRGSEVARPGLLSAVAGLGKVITLQDTIPVGGHHWYWDPSRAIPASPGEVGPITEFPFFTFLYADLHAHMINLPLTVLALAWGLSWVLAAEKRVGIRWPQRLLGIGIGALTLGVLGPTNAWDFPVYWTLGAVAASAAPFLRTRKLELRSAIEAGLTAAALLLFASLLFRPYYAWYGAGYTQADLWEGSRTSLDGYLTVHGLYLTVLLPWLAWETRQWMAATPLSSLSRLRPYFGLLLVGVLGFFFGLAYLAADGVSIAPLVGMIVLWSGILLLRKDYPIEKRAALVMIGTAAALTFLVEVVVLRGDIGRMNTVFKFYLQVWTLFSLAASGALTWLLADLPAWGPRARRAWQVAFAVVLLGAAMYPLTATTAKIRDRMAPATPLSLDGMAFMTTASYDDLGKSIPLAGDYHAIQWMQDNVQGSPVIVEAQIPEYRWGSRFSIYTGLPTVLGWNWHQRQQRAAVESADVSTRAQNISSFYLTQSPTEALQFLGQYDVRYVIVGELEQLYYGRFDGCSPIDGGARVSCDVAGRIEGIWTLDVPVDLCETNGSSLTCPTGGLDKFALMAAQGYLRPVYQNGATTIYEVLS